MDPQKDTVDVLHTFPPCSKGTVEGVPRYCGTLRIGHLVLLILPEQVVAYSGTCITAFLVGIFPIHPELGGGHRLTERIRFQAHTPYTSVRTCQIHGADAAQGIQYGCGAHLIQDGIDKIHIICGR